jgi:translocation and assembly module TamA
MCDILGMDRTAPRHALCRGLLGAGALALALTLGLLPAPPAAALESVEIRVPGADPDLMAQIRASSLVLEAQAAGRVLPVDVMAAARAEYGRLLGLLYEQGYFAPVIRIRVDGREAVEVSTLRPPSRIGQVAVDVDLGPQFRFGRTEIAPLAPGTALPPGFARGEVARSTVVREAAGAALDGWRAQGHALAAPAGQEVIASHPDRRLDVALRIAPGPRLAFGALRPQGAEATRPERIRAIAGLPSGAVFDPAAVAEAEARLRRTGSFASVSLRPAEAANPDGTIDIEARLEEAPPRRLGAGAELDSESGLGLSGFWLHRNLLGGAERLRLEAAVTGIGSQVRGLGYTLDARYTRPATGRPDTDLELGLRAVRLDERDFGADQIAAEARLVRRWSDRLTGTLALQGRYERAAFGPARSLSGDFGTLGAEAGLVWDARNRPLDPSAGSYLAGSAAPYLGFGAARSGLRLRFDARHYADLGTEGRIVLAGRVQGAAVLGPGVAQTPREFLSYSGGGGTVRGLPFQSLGVTVGGVRSGGQAFAAISAEARVRVSPSLQLAAFADAGTVAERAFGGQSDWHAGAGVGLRYLTPVGPLRLDLATPLRRNAGAVGARSLQVYVGIGQAF